MIERQLIYNSITTPDGTTLESRHRHDFKMHTDAVTNKVYGIDGGLDYRRYIGDVLTDCECIVHYNDEPHEIVRDVLTWGSYGKNGDEPLRYIKIQDMSNHHISSCLELGYGSAWVREIFRNEISYRKLNNINIED